MTGDYGATVAHVIAALEAARAPEERAMLVFDADGTLWSGDVGFDLFGTAVREDALRDDALPRLRSEARSIGVSDRGTASELGDRLFTAHLEGRYPDAPAFAMMAWAFAGFTPEELDAYAERVMVETSLASRVFGFARELVAWGLRRGIEVVVCSASPRAIVSAGARLLGLSDEHVIAVTPEVAGGTIRDQLVGGPAPYAQGKPARLDLDRPGRVILGGFGDSPADAHFLRRARVPVGVRPHAKLLALAPTFSGFLVLTDEA